MLHVLQGVKVARARLETAHESDGEYAALSQPPGRPVFVNPVTVKYLVGAEAASAGAAKQVNACVHFADGETVDIRQGTGVANKRLTEARAADALFATFADPSGTPLLINCIAVTHLTAEQDGDAAPKTRSR